VSYGPVKAFTVGIASGAATSSVLDLGKSYSQMAVGYVTMSTGAAVSVYGAESATATPKPVVTLVPATATVAYQSLQIATSTSGSWAQFEAPPFQYVQFVTSAVVSGGVSFTVLVRD
jgi:hypothetical protein